MNGSGEGVERYYRQTEGGWGQEWEDQVGREQERECRELAGIAEALGGSVETSWDAR